MSSPSGCGGFLHTDRGVLSSPQYPQNYKPNMNCNWQVMVTSGFRVSVTFQSPFQIQGYGDHCSTGDYLEVSDYRKSCSKTEPVHHANCPLAYEGKDHHRLLFCISYVTDLMATHRLYQDVSVGPVLHPHFKPQTIASMLTLSLMALMRRVASNWCLRPTVQVNTSS